MQNKTHPAMTKEQASFIEVIESYAAVPSSKANIFYRDPFKDFLPDNNHTFAAALSARNASENYQFFEELKKALDNISNSEHLTACLIVSADGNPLQYLENFVDWIIIAHRAIYNNADQSPVLHLKYLTQQLTRIINTSSNESYYAGSTDDALYRFVCTKSIRVNVALKKDALRLLKKAFDSDCIGIDQGHDIVNVIMHNAISFTFTSINRSYNSGEFVEIRQNNLEMIQMFFAYARRNKITLNFTNENNNPTYTHRLIIKTKYFFGTAAADVEYPHKMQQLELFIDNADIIEDSYLHGDEIFTNENLASRQDLLQKLLKNSKNKNLNRILQIALNKPYFDERSQPHQYPLLACLVRHIKTLQKEESEYAFSTLCVIDLLSKHAETKSCNFSEYDKIRYILSWQLQEERKVFLETLASPMQNDTSTTQSKSNPKLKYALYICGGFLAGVALKSLLKTAITGTLGIAISSFAAIALGTVVFGSMLWGLHAAINRFAGGRKVINSSSATLKTVSKNSTSALNNQAPLLSYNKKTWTSLFHILEMAKLNLIYNSDNLQEKYQQCMRHDSLMDNVNGPSFSSKQLQGNYGREGSLSSFGIQWDAHAPPWALFQPDERTNEAKLNEFKQAVVAITTSELTGEVLLDRLTKICEDFLNHQDALAKQLGPTPGPTPALDNHRDAAAGVGSDDKTAVELGPAAVGHVPGVQLLPSS